jgi:hypothetical protein
MAKSLSRNPQRARRQQRAIERAEARAKLTDEQRAEHDAEAKAAYDYTHGGPGTIPSFQYVNDLLSS